MKRCKDCLPSSRPRPAPHPGPRCATHHRQRKRELKEKAHAGSLERRYAMSKKDYDSLLAFQFGTCAICRRANGRTRKLSVDHDHKCCPEPPICGACIRGLLCRPCNNLLGHLRDDPVAIGRALRYVTRPPFQEWLTEMEYRRRGRERE